MKKIIAHSLICEVIKNRVCHRWCINIGGLTIVIVLLLLSMRGVHSDSAKDTSCVLEDTRPYEFPLPYPAVSTTAPISPDWVRRIDRPFIRGISLGMYFQDQSYDYEQFLVDIKKTGASHVGYVVSWYQQNVRSTNIERLAGKTVSDARLIQTIHQARSRGLQVFLLPIVRLRERGPEDWRGVINPTSMDAWWESYRTYILHYARLSANHGVELYCVGSELVSMEKHRERWLSLIDSTRRIFRGTLVYSANWDHYQPVSFWDSLDYIGISNYYELSKQDLPPTEQLRNKWRTLRKEIEAWKRQYPRQPLLFTEVGYYSELGTNIYPWDYTRNKPISLEEQRRCYQAFADVWSESPELNGVFFWNWFGPGGKLDKGYTPRGKPAECVLREWFAKIQNANRK